MKALVFDDDPAVAGMLSDLLRRQGLEVLAFHTGRGALEEIRRAAPGLVFVDIMMPGCDGLSLCREIKADPALAATKVVVASGNTYPEVAREARRLGASAFLKKPFDYEELQAVVRRVLAGPERGSGKGSDAPPDAPVAEIRVWGHRGPAPDGTLETSCVSLEAGGRRVVLDAGSGLRLLAREPDPEFKELWLFLTHYHPDHVEGLRHLRWAYDAAFTVNIAGPSDTRQPLKTLVREALAAGGEPRAKGEILTLSEYAFALWPGMRVNAIFTMHPVAAMAYQLQTGGKRVVYCPDNELGSEEELHRTDFGRKLMEFIEDADLLVHDARYLDEDMPGLRGQGHSCPGDAARLAASAGVRKLLLFHSDARYSRERLDAAVARLQGELRERGERLRVELPETGGRYAL